MMSQKLQIYCVNLFQFNIQLAKKGYRWQLFIFMENVFFSFPTFLEFRPKLGVPRISILIIIINHFHYLVILYMYVNLFYSLYTGLY